MIGRGVSEIFHRRSPELRLLAAAGLRLILDQLVPQTVSSLVLLIIPQRNIIEINRLKAFSF